MKTIDKEKVIERELVRLVKINNGMCIKLICDFITGLPDRLCLFPGGKIAFVEVKTTGKKPRPTQIYIHNKLKNLGFRVEVIDTIHGLLDFINSIY